MGTQQWMKQTKISDLIGLILGRFSQSWHCYHLGPDDVLLWEMVSCFAGCLASSLVSTYQRPEESRPTVVTTRISADCATWPLGASHPWLEVILLWGGRGWSVKQHHRESLTKRWVPGSRVGSSTKQSQAKPTEMTSEPRRKEVREHALWTSTAGEVEQRDQRARENV